MSQVYPPEGIPALGPIPRVRFLDPRTSEEAGQRPIPSSVNIPLAELPARMHELPPPSEPVVLPDLPGLDAAIEWLRRGGRQVVVKSVGTTEEDPGRLWEPNAFLARIAPDLVPGTALDVGCGAGRDAVYLASLGWQVTAWDRLPDALDRARDLERRYLGRGAIEWAQVDVERGLPEAHPFNLILMGFFLHRPLLARVSEWMRPGGALIIETFSEENRRVHGRPARSDLALSEDELPELLGGLQIEVAEFSCIRERHLARVWASHLDLPFVV